MTFISGVKRTSLGIYSDRNTFYCCDLRIQEFLFIGDYNTLNINLLGQMLRDVELHMYGMVNIEESEFMAISGCRVQMTMVCGSGHSPEAAGSSFWPSLSILI